MAREEHLEIVRQGVDVWNSWRQQDRRVRRVLPDLSSADLRGAILTGANLENADLEHADLAGATLIEVNLTGAFLTDADLEGVNLWGASLAGAHLNRANLAAANLTRAYLGGDATLTDAALRGATLYGTNLINADLTGTDLTNATLFETVFANIDLSGTKGLDACVHQGPSTIDHRTLQRSGQLPLSFLRGCGLPDNLIEYLPSLLNQAIQFYSCFISYSSKDGRFARRLHADLQDKGIRCWFAPEDMKIGDRLTETIDRAVRLRDKLLLILSETSIASAWVRKEVQSALAEEERQGKPVLFPIRLDDAVMDTTEQWADDIRRSRHIGNFRHWRDHDAYTKAFERLLRDLRIDPS